MANGTNTNGKRVWPWVAGVLGTLLCGIALLTARSLFAYDKAVADEIGALRSYHDEDLRTHEREENKLLSEIVATQRQILSEIEHLKAH